MEKYREIIDTFAETVSEEEGLVRFRPRFTTLGEWIPSINKELQKELLYGIKSDIDTIPELPHYVTGISKVFDIIMESQGLESTDERWLGFYKFVIESLGEELEIDPSDIFGKEADA